MLRLADVNFYYNFYYYVSLLYNDHLGKSSIIELKGRNVSTVLHSPQDMAAAAWQKQATSCSENLIRLISPRLPRHSVKVGKCLPLVCTDWTAIRWMALTNPDEFLTKYLVISLLTYSKSVFKCFIYSCSSTQQHPKVHLWPAHSRVTEI